MITGWVQDNKRRKRNPGEPFTLSVTSALLSEIRKEFPQAASAQPLNERRILMLAYRLNSANSRYSLLQTLGALPSNPARLREFAPIIRLRNVLPFFDAVAAGGPNLDVIGAAMAQRARNFIGPPSPRIEASLQNRAAMFAHLARQFIDAATDVRQRAKEGAGGMSFEGARTWLLTEKLPRIHLVIFKQPVGFSNNAPDANPGLFFIHLCAKHIGVDATPAAIAKDRARAAAKRRDALLD